MILFVRRRGLGYGSCKGMSSYLSSIGVESSVWRNDEECPVDQADLVVRWGCTSSILIERGVIWNKAKSIHLVNDKKGFSQLMRETDPSFQPECIYSDDIEGIDDRMGDKEWVLRPSSHSRGRNLWVVDKDSFLPAHYDMGYDIRNGGWYMRELIKKKAEYRVYVMKNKIVSVARKIPSDPTDVAWNVSQGGTFSVVRWGDWPLTSCLQAIKAHDLSGLDFSGVDVMVDENNTSYIIEINSAPSLPSLSDGSISYRQRCMAKSIGYHYHNGYNSFDIPAAVCHYSELIHPATTLGENHD